MNFNTVARFNRAGSFNIATDHLLSATYLDLSTLDIEEARISQGVLDLYPQITAKINGEYTLPTTGDQYAYLTTTDHLGVTHAPFIGIIPNSQVEYNPGDDQTELTGYGLGWYQMSRLVPEEFTHNVATKNPALTLRGVIGGDEWVAAGGVEPYRIMPVAEWGTTLNTRVFDYSRSDMIKTAIDEICDYCRHVYMVKSAMSSGNPVSRAYFVHENYIDTYLDLPTAVTISDDDCEEGVKLHWKGEEAYNQVLVIGRSSTGTLLSASYSSTAVTQGDTPARTYVENYGTYTTQAQLNARALELYTLYCTAASVFTATLPDRTDLELMQKIKHPDLSSSWQRITNIEYVIGPEAEKSVDIQFTSDAKFSNMRRMYRSMLPDPVSETQTIFADSAAKIPGNEVGVVQSIDIATNTCVVLLEDGRTVTTRYV